MFTGLIERVGTIAKLEIVGDSRRLTVEIGDDNYLHDAQMGESIAVNGVCLTVIEYSNAGENHTFAVEAVEETMRRTSLGKLQIGSRVNLERAKLLRCVTETGARKISCRRGMTAIASFYATSKG